jgi:ribosomal protein L32
MTDEQQVCPNCGNFNRAGARFCSKCGHIFKPSAVAASPVAPAPTPASRQSAASASSASVTLCPNCGKEVGGDTRFCRHCGHPLSTAQPSAVNVVASPAAASRAAAPPAAPSPVAPGVSAVAGDDDMTQPLAVISAPPQSSASPQSLAPAKSAPHPPTSAERGAPAWLWALVGLLIGVLLGAGSVLAAPSFVGLARIDAPEAAPDAATTDAMTPAQSAVTDAAAPLDPPTATSDVAATATSKPPPTTASPASTPPTETVPANAPPADEGAAPSADAPVEATEAVTAPGADATPEILFTSTPLTP